MREADKVSFHLPEMPEQGKLAEADQTREMVTARVQNAILEGADDKLRRAEWRTAVCFLTNRNRDQAMVIAGLQDTVAHKTSLLDKAARQEGLF